MTMRFQISLLYFIAASLCPIQLISHMFYSPTFGLCLSNSELARSSSIPSWCSSRLTVSTVTPKLLYKLKSKRRSLQQGERKFWKAGNQTAGKRFGIKILRGVFFSCAELQNVCHPPCTSRRTPLSQPWLRHQGAVTVLTFQELHKPVALSQSGASTVVRIFRNWMLVQPLWPWRHVVHKTSDGQAELFQALDRRKWRRTGGLPTSQNHAWFVT